MRRYIREFDKSLGTDGKAIQRSALKVALCSVPQLSQIHYIPKRTMFGHGNERSSDYRNVQTRVILHQQRKRNAVGINEDIWLSMSESWQAQGWTTCEYAEFRALSVVDYISCYVKGNNHNTIIITLIFVVSLIPSSCFESTSLEYAWKLSQPNDMTHM